MMGLLEAVYNGMSIEEIITANEKGYEFIINDGEVKEMYKVQ